MENDRESRGQSNQLNQPQTIIIQQPQPEAPVKAGIVVLVAAWIFLLIPIPVLSMIMAGVLGTAVVVISIICMVRGKVGVGIALLAADIIGGIIFYFIGLAILVALMGAGAVLGGGM